MAGGIMFSACPSLSRKCDITGIPRGNFFKFDTSVHLYWRRNWLDFGCHRSQVKVTMTSLLSLSYQSNISGAPVGHFITTWINIWLHSDKLIKIWVWTTCMHLPGKCHWIRDTALHCSLLPTVVTETLRYFYVFAALQFIHSKCSSSNKVLKDVLTVVDTGVNIWIYCVAKKYWSNACVFPDQLGNISYFNFKV